MLFVLQMLRPFVGELTWADSTRHFCRRRSANPFRSPRPAHPYGLSRLVQGSEPTSSPNGQRIVTGSGNSTETAMGRERHNATVWNALNGQRELILAGHWAQINSVAFSPDGERIITGSSDQTCK